MISDLFLNHFTIFNIGINFIEVTLELIIFLFFLLNARKEKTEKGIQGAVSINFSLAFLSFAIGRSFFIIWDYFSQNSLFRVLAWPVMSLGVIFVFIVYFRVFEIYLPRLRVYISIMIPLGVSLMVILFIFVFVLKSTLGIYLIISVPLTALCIPPVYAFTKCFIEQGGEIRKYMVLVMVGLLISLFGYLFGSSEPYYVAELGRLIKVTGHTTFVIGIILFAIGFWSIPSIKELDWREKMRHLYIIMEGGANIYDQSFIEEGKTFESESDLIAGGLSGITNLIQEMTKSAERVEVIKQKDLRILIKYGQFVTAALIAEDDLEILHSKLKSLVEDFESLFQYILPEWKGDLEVFSPVKVMVEKIFQ